MNIQRTRRGATIALAGLVLGAAAALVPAAAANATHPAVQGTASCNTATGLVDVTWHVTGDAGYGDVSAIVTEQSAATSPTLVGLTVKGADGHTVTQTGLAHAASYSLTVGVQFANHSRGDIVRSTGTAYTGFRSCTQTPPPTPDPIATSGSVTFVDSSCVDNAPVGNSATVTLGEGVTASYTLNGGAPVAVAAGTYGNDAIVPGDYIVTLAVDDLHALPAGAPTVFSHTFVAPVTECEQPPVECPEGQVIGDDGECYMPPVECPEGTVLDESGECVEPPVEGCPDGSVRDDSGECVLIPEPPTCPEGTELSGETCEPIDEPCPGLDECPTPTPTPTPDVPKNLAVTGNTPEEMSMVRNGSIVAFVLMALGALGMLYRRVAGRA